MGCVVNNKVAVIGIAVLTVAGVSMWLWPSNVPETTSEQASQPTATPPFNATPDSIGPTAQPEPSSFMADETPPGSMTQEEEDYLGETFNVDATGNLLTDVRARNTLEKLYALYTPEQQAQRLQELSQELSPAAYARVAELLERYKEYSVAAKQALPPDEPVSSAEEALVQLETLSSLRVAHFGADAAKGMFGDEERLNHQLIALMRLEKDESLTMEEKAQRAQALISSSPDLADIEKRNRESAEN
jgi:lipase chaperone LimK